MNEYQTFNMLLTTLAVFFFNICNEHILTLMRYLFSKYFKYIKIRNKLLVWKPKSAWGKMSFKQKYLMHQKKMLDDIKLYFTAWAKKSMFVLYSWQNFHSQVTFLLIWNTLLCFPSDLLHQFYPTVCTYFWKSFVENIFI